MKELPAIAEDHLPKEWACDRKRRRSDDDQSSALILLRDCTATTSPDFCMDATIYNVRQCFGFVLDSGSLTLDDQLIFQSC